MLLNSSALNAAGFNSSARITFLLAFCALAGTSSVSAEPKVTRYCASQVAGSGQVAASALQHFKAQAAVTCTATVLAVEPYQTFATAAVMVSSGATAAQAVITRFGDSLLYAEARLVPNASTKQVAYSSFIGTCAMVPVTTVTRPGFASLVTSASALGNPYVIRRGLTAFAGTGDITADGSFVQSAKAVGGGSSTLTANAGYTKPSATVVVSGAQVFAYAKATRLAKVAVVGSAQTTAKAKYHANGVANITGSASIGAWVVQMQGAAQTSAGTGHVVADATYVHEASSQLGGGAVVESLSFSTCYAVATVVGGGLLRAESTVNNKLDGYADPGAMSQISLNAQGVVVAPVISHLDGSSSIQANATYVHRAKASGGATAQVVANALYSHEAAATLGNTADVAADAHWQWEGIADVLGSGFALEALPHQKHQAKVLLDSTGDLTAIATRVHRASAEHAGEADVVADSLMTRYGFAEILGEVSIVSSPAMVGSPSTRDPAERTMYRMKSERVMRRPFVDRVMKAKRI